MKQVFAPHPRFWKLTALLLLVWALLSFQLGQRSLWIDEHVTTQMIAGSRADVIAAAVQDVHPPLYFLALREWVSAAGASDLAVRWPSAAAGLVGVALLARLARRWAGGRAVLPAAALLGLNPAFVEFSRMARYYALLLAFGVLATALLLRAARRNRVRDWAAYAAAGLVMVFISYPAALLLAAHALLLVWPALQRRALARWGLALAVTGGLYLPWLLTQVGSQVERVASFISADLARSGLGLVLGVAAGAYTFSAGETLFPWRPEAWLGLAGCLGLVWVGLRRGRPAARQALGMAGLGLVGVAALTTFVAASVPFLNVPARALFVLPYYLLAAASGLAALAATRLRLLLGAALLLGWGAGLFSLYTGQQFLNPIYYTPAREAAALVLQGAAPGELVISDGDSVFDRYFLPAAGERLHTYTHAQAGLAELLASARPDRVWLVTIGRDRTQVVSQAQAARETLAAATYTHVETERLLPIDPLYNRLKAALLRRPGYEYRLTVEVYERSGP